MGVKKSITPVLHQLARLSRFSLSRARRINAARILMFHGIGDRGYPAGVFERHITFLEKHFEIVGLDSLCEKLERSDAQLADKIALTFDDGLRNNFSVAYPILKKLDAPATFFVCPGLIENQRWLWNHEARARLKTLEAWRRAELARNWGATRFESADKDAPTHDVETIISWMKTLPLKTRAVCEDQLRDATKAFRPSAGQQFQFDIMNSDELRSLDPALITIGSHTVNHPILSTLQPDELQFEIGESRRLLETRLNRKVEFFCYPNGAFDPNVVAETRKHYRAAVTAEPGFVKPGCDRFEIPRIGSSENTALLAWRLHRPSA